MYNFAVTILLGLATVQVVSLIEGIAPNTTKFRSLVTLVVAVAGAFAIDYSLFSSFGVALRSNTAATATTGLVIAGAAQVWRTVLAYLGAKDESTGATITSHRIAA